MEIDDKGGEIWYNDIAIVRLLDKRGVCMELDMDMDQEGARLKNGKGLKFLDMRKIEEWKGESI